MRTKTLWIREEYLQAILTGHKRIEVRVGYSNINRLQAGDQLLLNDRHRYRVKRIGRYADFAELLDREEPSAIAPGTPAGELLAKMRAIYPPEKESLGVVALEIEPV